MNIVLSFCSTKMLPSAKHREIESKGRLFKEDWTEKYFFVEHNNKALCLICQETVAVFKEFNMNRHYETKHSRYSEITGHVVIYAARLATHMRARMATISRTLMIL